MRFLQQNNLCLKTLQPAISSLNGKLIPSQKTVAMRKDNLRAQKEILARPTEVPMSAIILYGDNSCGKTSTLHHLIVLLCGNGNLVPAIQTAFERGLATKLLVPEVPLCKSRQSCQRIYKTKKQENFSRRWENSVTYSSFNRFDVSRKNNLISIMTECHQD